MGDQQFISIIRAIFGQHFSTLLSYPCYVYNHKVQSSRSAHLASFYSLPLASSTRSFKPMCTHACLFIHEYTNLIYTLADTYAVAQVWSSVNEACNGHDCTHPATSVNKLVHVSPSHMMLFCYICQSSCTFQE